MPIDGEIFQIKIQAVDYTYENPGLFKDEDKMDAGTESSSSAPSGNGFKPNYNSRTNGRIKHPTSFWGTVFHVIFLSATSTVLFIPSIITSVGTFPGSITMLVIFLFYFYSMRMVIWCADEICKQKHIPRISYPDLVYETFSIGPSFIRPVASFARFLIILILFFSWFLSCIFISVLIAQTLVVIYSDGLAINLTAQSILLILLVPTLLLNMICSLKFLELVSVLGFILNLLTISLVVYYGAADSATWKGSNFYGSIDKIPLLISSIFSNMNITGLILSLKNEMKHPRKFTLPWGVMTIAYVLLFFYYLLLSLFFTLKFGNSLPTNAVDIMSPNSGLAFVTLLIYVFGQFLLYPIILYVPSNILQNQLIGEGKILVSHKVSWDYAIRIFLTILATFLAYISPGLTFFLSLFGSVFSAIDSIILPAVMQSIVKWKLDHKGIGTALILIKNLVIGIAGFYLMLRGISDCVVEWTTENNS